MYHWLIVTSDNNSLIATSFPTVRCLSLLQRVPNKLCLVHILLQMLHPMGLQTIHYHSNLHSLNLDSLRHQWRIFLRLLEGRAKVCKWSAVSSRMTQKFFPHNQICLVFCGKANVVVLFEFLTVSNGIQSSCKGSAGHDGMTQEIQKSTEFLHLANSCLTFPVVQYLWNECDGMNDFLLRDADESVPGIYQ